MLETYQLTRLSHFRIALNISTSGIIALPGSPLRRLSTMTLKEQNAHRRDILILRFLTKLPRLFTLNRYKYDNIVNS